MGSGWQKFAILGSTYARALENAATRGGRALAPAMETKLTQMRVQPQARLQQGLGQMFREHAGGGALTPTPQQADMQQMLARVPWAGAEHGGTEHAESTFNAMLRRRGLEHNSYTPGLSTHQRIRQEFGAPARPPDEGETGVVRAKAQGPSPLLHLDENLRTPGKLGLPSASTHVGPAPVAGPTSPIAGQQLRQPQPYGTSQQTMVSHGPWMPFHQRPIPGAARASGARTSGVGFAAPTEGTAVMKAGSALSTAAGVGIPLAVGGAILANKPGIRADLHNRLHEPGDIHQKDVSAGIPEPVMQQAQLAQQALAARGIDPAALRIAVDAPSGAGKTVLSRALAQQLGIRHHGLDWRPNLRLHQLMGGGDIEKTPYAPHAGEILEHQQLLRSYDPELFDVAIHIHKDPATIKQQLLQRGRGARTHDLLDYDKSIDVGRRAFETLGGDAIDLGNGTMMKIRPKEGWGDALDQQLAQAGIDGTGLSRHQKLLSLHGGQRQDTGVGWTPYVKSPFTGGEAAAIGASIPLGVMAARALAHH